MLADKTKLANSLRSLPTRFEQRRLLAGERHAFMKLGGNSPSTWRTDHPPLKFSLSQKARASGSYRRAVESSLAVEAGTAAPAIGHSLSDRFRGSVGNAGADGNSSDSV